MIRVPVLVHQHHVHWQRIERAVDTANALQGFARFKMTKASALPNYPRIPRAVAPGNLLQRIPGLAGGNRAIAVIQNPFDNDYFSWESRDGLLITTADWEEKFAPPTLETYLLYMFASVIVSFGADLPENIPPDHKRVVGCFYDLCNEKSEIRLGMVAASMCATCEGILAGMAVPDDAIRALNAVLSSVRDATIRRAREAPRHIFIAHGHAPVWLKLREFLVNELHLPVEEFSEAATAGRTTQVRLAEMLDRSRFAFAVMTAEDVAQPGEPRARQNVIHELGLCQGRLGFEKVVMLVEKGVAEPSNMYGVVSIGFHRRTFGQAKKSIRKALRGAGILG